MSHTILFYKLAVVFSCMLLICCTLCGCRGEQLPSTLKEDAMGVTIDNDTTYLYNGDSRLTIEDFAGVSTLTDLQLTCGSSSIRKAEQPIYCLKDANGNDLDRENAGYYTVYSLENGALCYVFLQFSPYTGTNFYVTYYVEFPSGLIDEDFYAAILQKDYPENILPGTAE